MIEELGPEARALLDAARFAMSPDAAAVQRVRAKISIATSGAPVGTALGMKLGIIALAAVVAVGAGLYARRGVTAAMAPQVELASPSEVPLQTAMHEPAAPALTEDDLITIETPRIATPRRVEPASAVTPALPRREPSRRPDLELPARSAPAHSSLAARTATSQDGPPDGGAGGAGERRGIDLAREVELLDVAMAALRRGDANAALHAVQRHAIETAGHGQLAEDAAAIEVEALCHLHDPATNAKLEAFDARFPQSAQRSRLANRCP